ncbi:MAG TPA: anthranilate synthase component I, partial [Streptosporangiaceae bacterium]|nr:anthranilate synthase component I [Streptosporangiaceae bacterium]
MDVKPDVRTDFETGGGVRVTRIAGPFDPGLLAGIAQAVDDRRGGVLSSGMEYPGRYSRWHIAYADPCVEIVARGRRIGARALNDRGRVLLPVIGAALQRAGTPVPDLGAPADDLALDVAVDIAEPDRAYTEEERSRRPTVFSALREVIAAFGCDDPNLGLYGAFGYDLAFQFEPVRMRLDRPAEQRDLVLHLPDEVYVLDRKREQATRFAYEFTVGGVSTEGLPRLTERTTPPTPPPLAELPEQPKPGSYAQVVAEARERFARGDLF